MDTKILWANPVRYSGKAWQGSRKVEIILPRVTRDAARAHLALHWPDGIIVGVERGPRGGWADARYFTCGQQLPGSARLEWYMVREILVQLSGQPAVSTGT